MRSNCAAIVAAAFAATVAGTGAGHAQEYPWCAVYGDPYGATNCGFVTLEQCRAAVSGNGGYCTENLFYSRTVQPPAPPRRAPRNR